MNIYRITQHMDGHFVQEISEETTGD